MTHAEAVAKSEKFIKALERRLAAKQDVRDGKQTEREKIVAKDTLWDAAALLADMFVNEPDELTI